MPGSHPPPVRASLPWQRFDDPENYYLARTEVGTYRISLDDEGWHLQRPGEIETTTRPSSWTIDAAMMHDLKAIASEHYAQKLNQPSRLSSLTGWLRFALFPAVAR